MFFFRMNFLDVLISIFVSSPKQKKYCSACGGLRPPQPLGGSFAPCAPGPAPYPHTSSLSSYIPGYLGLAGVVSHLRAYTRYVELYTQNCIK